MPPCSDIQISSGYLLDKGADVNAKNNSGVTALMSAAYAGQADSVKALLERKANVNLKDSSGNTALSLAKKKGKKDVLSLLSNAGAK